MMSISFDQLKNDMEAGEQAPGISYWKHGEMVAERFADLMKQEPEMEWKFPSWFSENAEWVRHNLAKDYEIISTYQLWHDCSKPYCLTIDSEGRKHYPNHAEMSGDIWLSLGGNSRIAKLISQDMLCHHLRPSGALEFAQTNENALILIITSLCELHANSGMFGGFDSSSFKIKWKYLDKCGKAIIKCLKGSPL